MRKLLDVVQTTPFDYLGRTEAGNAILLCSEADYDELRTLAARFAAVERERNENAVALVRAARAADERYEYLCKTLAERNDAVLGLSDLKTPRTLDEWHDDIGPVLWWKLPVDEPPYAGTPLDEDWPDYHTHWTPIPVPDESIVESSIDADQA